MDYAVAVFEFRSIAKGIEASDQALKAAGVEIVSAEPVCPGKFELLITGELAQVEASADKIEQEFEEYLVDTIRLGRIDVSVLKALLGAQPQPKPGALGVVETFTVASTIMAADRAVKASRVEILELRVARGMAGKGYVSLVGDVADVKAAMEAGAQYAQEQGTYIATSLMAAPHPDLWDYL